MILLDAYALVAAATGEAAAAEVAELLRGGDCAVTTASLAELYDQLVRRVGLDPEVVDTHVRPLLDEPLALRNLDRERAARAGLLRAQLYRRRTAELSLADCVLLASLEEGGHGRHRRPAARPRRTPTRSHRHSAGRLARTTTLASAIARLVHARSAVPLSQSDDHYPYVSLLDPKLSPPAALEGRKSDESGRPRRVIAPAQGLLHSTCP